MEIVLGEELYIFLIQYTIAILVIPDPSPGCKGDAVFCWTALIFLVVCVFVRLPTEDKRNEFFLNLPYLLLLIIIIILNQTAKCENCSHNSYHHYNR